MHIKQRIKDKLVYLFVLRNKYIKEEYVPYVQSHLEEHRKHRIRHWGRLIRLNIHYRILRRPPYLYETPVSRIKQKAIEPQSPKNTVVSAAVNNAKKTKPTDTAVSMDVAYLIYLMERQMNVRRIDSIELYFLEVNYKREFSFGSWPSRLHCCVCVTTGDQSGWGEICLPIYEGKTKEDVIRQITKDFEPWQGANIERAKFLVKERRGKTADRVLEALDMALVDLDARLQGKSALEYLGLPDEYSVPALSCVLQKDIEAAVELAQQLATTHLKIKLFGDNVSDYNLIKAVRAAIPQECYLVGDVNMGYAPGKQVQPFSQDIVRAMNNLHEAGLNACEDPANLSWEGLAQLQRELPDMAIIPDEPMRPSYKILEEIEPVPGHIYNLHPNCMGSLTATVELAQKLRKGGANVMIGDSSLVGPACAAWQQVACGVHAEWCEALEKPIESTKFTDCILSTPMQTLPDGRRQIAEHALGFGLEVDKAKLAENSIVVIRI